MNIKCGICGSEIVIEGGLLDGQHVLCPYCGGKSEYRKPTRIELPHEIERRAAALDEEALESDDVPEMPAYKRNPNLYIRRPSENGSGDECGRRNALVDQVEARAKAESRRKLMMKLKKLASNVFASAVFVGIVAGGFKAYRALKSCPTGRSLSGSVNRVEDANVLTNSTAESNGVVPVLQKSVPHEDMQESAAEKPVSKELSDFEVATNRFVGCKVSYWGKLPKSKRPGSVDGLFYLLVPTRGGAGEYYEIRSSATNALRMIRLTEKQESRKPFAADGYAKLLTDRGGFLVSDGVAYLVTPTGSKKSYQAPTRVGESFDPAEAVFGAAYPAAQKMDTANLSFEVSFAFGKEDNPTKISEVRFGKSVPYEAFEKVAAFLAKEIRRKGAPLTLKTKKFKRTVVLYDGRLTSRGVGGVTKVPRNFPNARGERYVDWVRLRDEALRQESEVQRYEAEARRARKEWNERINGPVTESEIRKILLAGSVIVKRM